VREGRGKRFRRNRRGREEIAWCREDKLHQKVRQGHDGSAGRSVEAQVGSCSGMSALRPSTSAVPTRTRALSRVNAIVSLAAVAPTHAQ